ncbi:MAG: diguanylate cyclase [Nitrospirota bacterium]|nr:diguanylate cyclase [Nitrospirota bacterium]
MRFSFLMLLILLAFQDVRVLFPSIFSHPTTILFQGPASPGQERSNADPFQKASVEDLKRSEEYLRKDLGLDDLEDSSEPLWIRSAKRHPILVVLTSLMFLGGLSGFLWILKRYNRELEEGLALSRENMARSGGSYGGRASAPTPIQEIIAGEEHEIQSLPSLPHEKIPRMVDSVLDSLRYSLGSGARISRVSLFLFDDIASHFRVCGFSKGEDFHSHNPVATPPENIFSTPLRTLSEYTDKGASGKKSLRSWSYPFVIDSGEFCAITLEMPQGDPPDNWGDYLQGSLHLMKALVSRQKYGSTDVTLTTRDDSGSLDYRATLNRLVEEWARTRKVAIPFSVIAIQIDNVSELRKYYGSEAMDLAWNRLVALLKSILRQTDWVMRPDKALILVQLLEASYADGLTVQKRIARALEGSVHKKTIDRPMHYRGVLVAIPVDSSVSVTTLFDQILRRFDERTDFEGDFYYR